MRLLIEHKTDVPGQHDYAFWCPACKHAHVFTVGAGAPWTFNGNFDKPSFSPSLKTVPLYCHFYVTDGQIQYLADSLHALKGQTVPMVDWQTILPAGSFPPAEEKKPMEVKISKVAGAPAAAPAPAAAAAASAADVATKKMAIGYITSITGDRANAEAISEKIGHARVAQACKDGKDPFHL